eukprot:gnl/TRDRNA2_/TRDRNA2_135190_c0_seq1.p1 gnl/TRDRNA2_/TRDRNA2_135190_c0~~gnl/TRDRNA2_/TRDRNA2_135190_c0_seq1.p1  ORF type:complete len:370 (-),score=50.92 gnl/TRDRNA2_/TRDRNA2_135190_c0_seq1:496-1605(-)
MAPIWLAIWLVLTVLSANGHRPAHTGVTCGKQFSTPDSALHVHDIEIEWAGSRTVTCDNPMLWVTYDVPESMVGKNLYLSAGGVHTNSNPEASRYAHLRMDAVLLGPGMPALNRSELPAHVSVPEEFQTGKIFRSPADQSTCAHSEWMAPMGALTEVGEPTVCTFYEPFTATYMPVVLDVTPTVMQAGKHYAGFYLRTYETGKLWFAVGVVGGKEDFRTRFEIPKGECDCGDYQTMSFDFHEKGKLHGNVPKVISCDANPPMADYCTMPEMPEEKKDAGDCADDNAAVEEAAGAWGVTECRPDLCEGQYADMMKPLCMKTCGMCSETEPEPEETEEPTTTSDSQVSATAPFAAAWRYVVGIGVVVAGTH